MLDQSINQDTISQTISFRLREKYPDDFANGDNEVIQNAIDIHGEVLPSYVLKTGLMKKSSVYTIDDCSVEILHDKLVYNLRKINRLKQEDRQNIVTTVKRLLEDKNKLTVLRLDIKDFYKSIDIDTLLEKLSKDPGYGKSTLMILNKLRDLFDQNSVTGLPRGLGVSASLAELKMRQVDKKIRKADNVYYYARFVDDIIVFISDNSDYTKNKIVDWITKEGLRLGFSQDKYTYQECVPFNKSNKLPKQKSPLVFSYLGYEFKLYDNKVDNEWQRVLDIDLSEGKFKKFKTRIVKALVDYDKNKDERLLKNRIRFLTSNYYLVNRKRSTKVRTGIFYNYPLINNIQKDSSKLKSLDDFKNKILFDDKFRFNFFSKRIPISIQLKKDIAKMSFRKGWERKFFCKFSVSLMKKIKRNWAY